MASFNSALSLFSSSFVEKKRDNGEKFLVLSSDSPGWFQNSILEAHNGEFPNDSRYQLIRDCLVSLSAQCPNSEEEARESVYDLSLDLLPCSTADLLRWFADHPARLADCDDAIEEGRAQETVYNILSEGFRIAAENTLYVLISEIEENRSSIFNPDTDCRLILSDSLGSYIPQTYCASLSEDDAEAMGLDWEDVQSCQDGPDSEHYWDAWQAILDSAIIRDNDGTVWNLHQNGDLWEIRDDVEIPEGF